MTKKNKYNEKHIGQAWNLTTVRQAVGLKESLVDRSATALGYTTILNKSENATLQLSIFYETVWDKNYLLTLNNVAQTSSKRFVETPPICLV